MIVCAESHAGVSLHICDCLYRVPGVSLHPQQRVGPDIVIVCAECQQSLSTPNKEWVLTDMADNTQLGAKDRLREKMLKINQDTPSLLSGPVAAIAGEL